MNEDLSRYAHPIGGLFEFPRTASTWQAFRLTDSQVAQYHAQGYVAGVRVLDAHQLETLRQELSEFFHPQHAGQAWWYEYHSNESQDPSTVLFHALGAWRMRPGFHDLLWHPAWVVPASQLLGGRVRFWHDQLFCKPARHGGVVAWHQDYSYWTRTRPMAHVTCWIALDDTTRDNGCVNYVPGSHQWNLLPITGLAGDMGAIREVLSDDQWERMQHPVAIELSAGEATFHHPLMIHGSRENRTDGPRRATVINAVLDGVRSSSDSPLLAGVPPVSAGAPLGGPFFPLLFDPAVLQAGA